MNDPTDRQSIAREYCTDRPDFIGSDGDGAAHFWSTYDQTVIVVEADGRADTCTLDDCYRPLKHWQDHTADERGWDECRITDQPLLPAGGL